MPSLAPDYLRRLSFSGSQVATIPRLGEARGRQDLFVKQLAQAQLRAVRAALAV